ncbi:hypothetical protein GCM10010505_29980 [Kitasatospora aburaviensis]
MTCPDGYDSQWTRAPGGSGRPDGAPPDDTEIITLFTPPGDFGRSVYLPVAMIHFS